MLLMMITAMYFLNVFQDKQMEALVEKLCNRFSGVTGVCSLYLIYPFNWSFVELYSSSPSIFGIRFFSQIKMSELDSLNMLKITVFLRKL